MSFVIGGRRIENWQLLTGVTLALLVLQGVVLVMNGGIPHAPGTISDPHPGVPPTPHPLPGEEGFKIPGEERPPIGEGEEKPTYH